MSRIGLLGATGSRLAHIAVWAVAAALVLTLIGSALPSGWGVAPALGATSLQKAKTDLAQAKKELKALQVKLDKLAKQQSDAEADLESTTDRVAEVQAKMNTAQQDLTGLRAQLADRLAEMYKNRDSNGLDLLNAIFSGDDTSLGSMVKKLAMVSHIARSDTKLVNTVVARLADLKSMKADLAAEKSAAKRKSAKYEAARDATLASLENAKGDYNRLHKRVATLTEQARQAELEAQRAAAAEKLAQAKAKKKATTATTTHRTTPTTTKPKTSSVTADFVFPVDGPNSFSDTFGAPRSGGRTHQGCDIFTARNTPLVACVSGTITSTNPTDTGLGGITIHLRGSNGTVYYYAHMSSIKSGIRAGVHVSAGDVVGYAGNTGNASGGAVHLHFEIRPHGGSAIDPYTTLIKYR